MSSANRNQALADQQAQHLRSLNLSAEATQIYQASDVIDLHIDSFIWSRFGYDLKKRHGKGLLNGWFYSQVDFPRMRTAGLTGGTWVITTNPFRSAAGRERTFEKNLARMRQLFDEVNEDFSIVTNVAEYRAARADNKHGVFVGIQGGNALDHGPDSLDLIPDQMVLRITLVHLSTSKIGVTSSPARGVGKDSGLTDFGRKYIEKLNNKKIFVDLAHISRKGFFDAMAVHDKSQPVLVTHTGVEGVHPHWRNLTDEQIKAVADTGGTIGVMYQSSFLGRSLWGKSAWVLDHLQHIINVVGDDHVSLGSDWDGMIIPPTDLRSCLQLPTLVDHMLQRGWNAERIAKVLGGNFLRVVEQLRG